MGAWNEKNFGNDSALDWMNEFEDNPSIDFIIFTFDEVLNNDDYIDIDVASAALAAAEVVAALKGKKCSDFPEEIEEQLDTLSLSTGLDKTAIKAIQKIIKGSELQELWEEDSPSPEWRRVVNDLISRLS